MAMADKLPSTDQLYLEVNNQRIYGWQSATVSRGVERCPATFEISMTERNPNDGTLVEVTKGMPCTLAANGDILLIGYVMAVERRNDEHSHEVHIQGASKCVDLVESDGIFSYNGTPTTMNKSLINVKDIAENICEPFGISVISDNNAIVTKLLPYNVVRGTTAYQIIEENARISGLLAYDDFEGNLVLAQAGKGRHDGVIAQGPLVQAAALHTQDHQRFTRYEVYYQTTDVLVNGVAQFNLKASRDDPYWPKRADGKPRYRPKFIVSNQSYYGNDAADYLAGYYAARMAGRSQSAHVSVQGWRDRAGTLWTPNKLAEVFIPAEKLTDNDKPLVWTVASVTYVLDSQYGQIAQLELMSPDAFRVNQAIDPGIDYKLFQAAEEAGKNKFSPPDNTTGT